MRFTPYLGSGLSLFNLPAWLLLVAVAANSNGAQAPIIGNHRARYDSCGLLESWTSWHDALNREVNWYLKCPVEHGYPRFVFTTFMDGNYQPVKGESSFIPAMQDGMGILSYLKYYKLMGKKDPRLLRMARSMGDYLVNEDNTPDTGKYPRFTRSTGRRAQFPQPPDCGSQDDRPYEIEPDKGGLAGFALAKLYEATRDRKYLDQALRDARDLVRNQREGTATQSPWPFRVDYRTGAARGSVSGNMSYILRLFDELMAQGYPEFQGPRKALWKWIKQRQIPSAAKDGRLWVSFFEDHSEPTDQTAWAPLNLARYLIEKREALDPDWKKDARTLLDYVDERFVHLYNGVALCGEQAFDQRPWGGIATTYGAVATLFAKATGSPEFKVVGHQALNWTLYSINDDGCSYDGIWKGPGRGGWQEDAHTDTLHNYVDAINAFPAWAK